MTVYTKSMMESLAEVRGLQENNMVLMRKAAGQGGMQTLKMKDGKLKMDKVTASAIMQVYDKLNPANQKKMEQMINNGKKSGIIKVADFAMSKVTGFKSEETELDEAREKSARQLVDPKKEVMVVKKNKVVVIDKKDQDKYLKQGWELAEETELDEGKIAGSIRWVRKWKESGLSKKEAHKRAKEMDIHPKVVDDLYQKEEIELDEAPKYELYHKDFSSAMQHAYKMAKKLHGITIKPSEIDDKVASGPRKPSEGKTNTYRLEGDKGAIQVQVYNKGGSKPYELNFYKEDVDLDEMSPKDKILKKTADHLQALIKGSNNPDDKAAFAAARDYVEAGNLETVATIVKKLDTAPKEAIINAVAKGMGKKEAEKIFKVRIMRVEEVGLDEGKMKELHMYISQGKSAEWIAKKMGVDVKTIKALMDEYESHAGDGMKENGKYMEMLAAACPSGGAAPAVMEYDPTTEAYELGTNEYREYLEKLTPGEVDEASARADAARAMRADPSMSSDPFSKDVEASPEDVKGAEKNIINQLRGLVSLRGIGKITLKPSEKKALQKKGSKYLKTLGSGFVQFGKGQEKVDIKVAQAVLNKFNSIKKPADKEKFQAQVGKSYKDMLKVLKAGYNEEVEIDEALPGKWPAPGVKKGTRKDLEKLEKELRAAKKKKDKEKAAALQKELERLMKSGAGKKIGPAWMHKEEVDLDEAKIAFKTKAKDGGYFVVLHRDTSGMKGKQDKFLMRHMKGGKVKDWGSHSSVDGAKKFAVNRGIIDEETILERIDRKLKERKNG